MIRTNERIYMSEENQKALTTVERSLTDIEFKKSHNDLAKFVKTQLREATGFKDAKGYDKITSGDYGIIPRTNKKSLLKPGAEKLLKLFGFTSRMELVKEVEDFEHAFVLYKYRCVITHAASGTYIADAIRSCNNKEGKHASKSVYDAANTIESIAQKRALVAATVQATMASEIFDADVSENDEEAPNNSTTAQEDPRRNRLIAKLYATATERGWTDKWIHAAVAKKWKVESLTNISNDQIDELTEFIVTKYTEVGKGNKPVLRETIPVNSANETAKGVEVTNSESVERIDAEVIEPEKKEANLCRNKKKHGDGKVVVDHADNPDYANPYFCNKECENEYWGESAQRKSKMEEFIEKGKQKKAAEEAQQV